METATNFPNTTAYLAEADVRSSTNAWFDRARLLSFGSTLLVAIWENPDSTTGTIAQIRVYYSTNGGGTFTAGAVIPSGDGPKAFVKFTDNTGTVVPVLITQESIYKVGSADTTFSELLPLSPLSGDPNDGRNAIVAADGHLFVPIGSGDMLHIVYVGDGQYSVSNAGPETGRHGDATGDSLAVTDGIPGPYDGHINYLLDTPSPWIFAAYGGHAASKNASILSYNKITGVWNVEYAESDANVDITWLGFSSEDDATPRLHFALEGAAASEMFHIEEPFKSPTQGAHKFQLTSFIELPEDDLGDPQNSSAVLAALVDAGNLSADTFGEYITLKYGIDGAAWTDTTLGNFLSGDTGLGFGTNGVGIAAKTLRVRLEFTRDAGDNTDSPLLKEFETQGRQKHAVLRYWQFTIDLETTADLFGGGAGSTTEDLITAIENLTTNVVMFPFVMGEMSASAGVEIRQSPQWDLRVVDEGEQGLGRRTGYVTVRVEELVANVTSVGVSTTWVIADHDHTSATTGGVLTNAHAETSLVLEQTTANYTLVWSDPAAARTITIPDPLTSGTFAFLELAQTFTATQTFAAVTLNAATAPAGTEVYAVHDNTGDLTLNAKTGKAINLAIAGTDEVTVSGSGLDMAANRALLQGTMLAWAQGVARSGHIFMPDSASFVASSVGGSGATTNNRSNSIRVDTLTTTASHAQLATASPIGMRDALTNTIFSFAEPMVFGFWIATITEDTTDGTGWLKFGDDTGGDPNSNSIGIKIKLGDDLFLQVYGGSGLVEVDASVNLSNDATWLYLYSDGAGNVTLYDRAGTSLATTASGPTGAISDQEDLILLRAENLTGTDRQIVDAGGFLIAIGDS